VYDPIQIVSIKNAKASKDISELSTQKTKEDATYDISKAYFQTLVIRMQLNILKNTLKSSEESLRSIELKYQTGVAKKIDVDRIRVSFNNTNSQLEEATLNYKQSLNRLKYAMGMPIDEQITWADTVISDRRKCLNINSQKTMKLKILLEYKINKTNLFRADLNKDVFLSSFLPTLSLVGNSIIMQ